MNENVTPGPVSRAADDVMDELLDEDIGADEADAASRAVSMMEARLSGEVSQKWIRAEFESVDRWRRENVPRADPLDQSGKVVGEAAELQDIFIKAEQYPGSDFDDEHAREEAGDVVVALFGLMGMMGWDPVECVDRARGKNETDEWRGERGL